jgi:arylsulfatase A-like enzyme
MAGLDLPFGHKTEGRDLIPLIKGGVEGNPKPIFAQYNMENFGIAELRMVRVGNWKLVKRFGLSANPILVDELYDLNSDPSENNNLISHPDHQIRRLELNMYLQNWMIKIKDPAL